MRASGTEVIGLDFSLPMLMVASRRTSALRAGISFLRGDALHMPFAEALFDVVTISYGLRNLADFQAGLNEMWRVLKPGGRLLVLDFGKPENASWRALYFGYLRWFVPGFGRFFCGDHESYAYILESLMHYPGQRGIADLMERMNFSEVRVIDFLGGVMSINYGVKGTSGASAVE